MSVEEVIESYIKELKVDLKETVSDLKEEARSRRKFDVKKIKTYASHIEWLENEIKAYKRLRLLNAKVNSRL